MVHARTSEEAPALTAAFWRTRRAAAIAGIVFGVLMLVAMTMARLALGSGGYEELQDDESRRRMIRMSLGIVPYAGIAFLWFIGVIREQLGDVEDRLFSTVFLGSGLLLLAMLFSGAVTTASMVNMLDEGSGDPAVWAHARDLSQGLISVYAMRMAAIFTISVSTAGLRASGLPRWICYLGYGVGVLLLAGSAEQTWLQLVFPGWVLLVGATVLLTPPRPRPHGAEA